MATASSDAYIKLVSAEKHVFVVERRVAMVSGMVRRVARAPTSSRVCQLTLRTSLSVRVPLVRLRASTPPPPLLPLPPPSPSFTQIRTMLSSAAFAQKEVAFPDISTSTLERVIEYFHYKVKYANSKGPVPAFDVPPEAALELLIAANYLDC